MLANQVLFDLLVRGNFMNRLSIFVIFTALVAVSTSSFGATFVFHTAFMKEVIQPGNHLGDKNEY